MKTYSPAMQYSQLQGTLNIMLTGKEVAEDATGQIHDYLVNLEEIAKAITKNKFEENLQEAKRVCNASERRDSCAPGILEEMERDWGVENTWMFFHRETRWSMYSAVRKSGEVRRLRIACDEFTPGLAPGYVG